MKTLLRFLAIICFLSLQVECTSSKISNNELQGIFVYKNNKNIKIILKRDTFTYVDITRNEHNVNPCCDTLAIGKFNIEHRGLISISSPKWMNSFFVNTEVSESATINNDSITFYIQNPIENDFRKFNLKGGYLSYSLLVQANSKDLDYFKENNKLFEENKVVYSNPEKTKIKSFKITIIPKSSLSLKRLEFQEIHTEEYYVKNSNSNYFIVNIPNLNEGYLSYKRLNGSLAKVINSDKIVWENKEFNRTKE